MTPVRLGEWNPDDPKWHHARSSRIGGSEVGAIMGWSPYQTREDIMLRKLGLIDRTPSTPAMLRGNYLEAGIRDWFCTETGHTITTTGATFLHKDRDWQLANPDGILEDGSILEIKTAKEKTADHGWGRAGTDQIPLTYTAQVQWYMDVMEAKECHVAVLFGSPFAFYKYRVKYDGMNAAYIRGHVNRFRTELQQRLKEMDTPA